MYHRNSEKERVARERIERNNAYYDTFAEKIGARLEKRDFSRAFDLFLSKADRARLILDIGCGAGMHARHMQEAGYQVLGIEPSGEMRAMAKQNNVNVIDGSFEELDHLSLANVGAVWCASSLLHVPIEEFPPALRSIHSLLQQGDPLFLTLRLGEGGSWDKMDDADGEEARFIQLYTQEYLDKELPLAGFRIADEWIEESYWGRESTWISIVTAKA